MNPQNSLGRLKYIVANNENGKALELLLDCIMQNKALSKYETEIIIIQSNFNDVKQRIRLGLEVTDQMKNSVTYRLLELIDCIEKENQSGLIDAYLDFEKLRKNVNDKKGVRLAIEVSGSALSLFIVLTLAPGILYFFIVLVLIIILFALRAIFTQVLDD